MVTKAQKQAWNEDGFLVLRNFVSNEEIETLQQAQDSVWKQNSSEVVVDDLVTQRRTVPCLLSDEEKSHRFKMNDLFLQSEALRKVVLSEKIVPIIKELLQDFPVLCNTLSLNFGTQQSMHADSLFMTPRTDNHLVATWIALEDGHETSGPLAYYPGSHKIPIYRFSTGRPSIVVDEFPLWQAHVEKHLRQAGLKRCEFTPKKGDLFVWSAQLIHGGAPILDPKKTRKSLVSHFYSLSDTVTFERNIEFLNGGFWQNRAPQPLGEREQALRAEFLEAEQAMLRRASRGEVRADDVVAGVRKGRETLSGFRKKAVSGLRRRSNLFRAVESLVHRQRRWGASVR